MNNHLLQVLRKTRQSHMHRQRNNIKYYILPSIVKLNIFETCFLFFSFPFNQTEPQNTWPGRAITSIQILKYNFTIQGSGKGVYDQKYLGTNDLPVISLRAGRGRFCNINNELHIFFWSRIYKNYQIFLKQCLELSFDGITFV